MKRRFFHHPANHDCRSAGQGRVDEIKKNDIVKAMNKKQKAHAVYIQALKKIGPEKRLLKAFELSELTRRLFVVGLRKKYPALPESEFNKILYEKIDQCRNQNY
jgi:hypothetical protein